jgi:anti-sigma28 factor (negative regulator of flagellin synthesis)
MQFHEEVDMSNKWNKKEEDVKRRVNETASTNHRANGKMKYQPYNFEGLTVLKQREFIRIRQLINNLPELRVDRIRQLTKAIDEGTYHVSSQKIAEAIIQKNFYNYPH